MNMPEIKISGSQNTVIKRILTIQDKLNYLELRSLFLNMYQIVGVNFISKLKELISIGFCAFLIINGKMSIGTLLSISFILGQLSTPILNFVNNIRDLQDTNIAHKRINEVYNESNEDQFELINQKIPSEIDSIIFSKVSFKYPGSFNPFVINNISLKILPNTITAIVGTSGSGKTTLMKLLLSYYKVNDGLILLNNSTNLSSINSEEWRNLCGTVLQDGHIFSTTIAQNIAIADEVIDNDKLIQSAKIACIHEFIIGLPMGYNTKIGSVGINLSGGQKQRILIARAVYKDPKFIFFDEATSSLDANNEQEIMKNLLTFFQGKTVIIIAHRLSTVKNADQILVLENGQICEFGNHDNLINIKGTYFNLIKNQLELGN
jgi:ATP-binding cassette subfamily B protein